MTPGARVLLVLGLLAPFGSSRAFPAPAPAPTALSPGIPVERRIEPGEVHVYETPLLAGQFFHVEIDQNHLDAAIRILSSEGTVLREVDNAGDRGDRLSLSIVASRDGMHRVEIRLRDKASAPGKYRISSGLVRAQTPDDARRMAAEALRDEADRLLVRRSAETSKQAVERYESALVVWREIADRREEASTLARMSDALSLLGDLRQALARAEETLALWRLEDDRRGQASALGKVGLAYSELGEQRRGLEYLDQALALFAADGDSRGQAETLNDIAVAHGGLGELPEAVARYTDAMGFADAAGDRLGVATILKNRAVDYLGLGEPDRALADLRDALARFHKLGSRREQGVTLYSMGNIFLDKGEIPEALRMYGQGLEILREAGDKRFQGFTWNHMGLAHLASGDTESALGDFGHAQELLHACEDQRGEAMVLTNIGVAHLARGDFAGARDRLQESLPRVQASADRIHEAMTLVHLARAERGLGDLETARSRIEDALRLTESLRGSIPGVGERAAFMAKTHERYDLLIAVLMDLHTKHPDQDWNAEALHASERAKARSLIELLAGARIDLRTGIDETLLAKERSLEARLETSRREEQRRLAGAASEPSASRALDALLTEYEDVQGRLRAASPRYAALERPRPLALKDMREQVLDADTLLLEYSLGDEHSFLWAVTSDTFSSHAMPPRATIEAAARGLYRAWSAGSGDPAEASRKAAALSRMLLGPVAGELTKKRLAIVVEGALLYVPFAALPSPSRAGSRAGDPLGARYELVSLPSATTLAVLRGESAGRAPAHRLVAVLADPVFNGRDPRVVGGRRGVSSRSHPEASGDDLARSMRETGLANLERLAGSRREAQAIVALAGPGNAFEALDFDASRAAALGPEVSTARVVHFASHALLDARHPELSGIVLSLVDEHGRPADGFLQTRDIYKLRLSADLVVLSACQTALGKEVRGEGLLGLSRGFMYAGAPRVIASLWEVPDRATSELMKRFYRGILVDGLRPAEALRTAQTAIRKDKRWSSPYYWAAFILQGDWN